MGLQVKPLITLDFWGTLGRGNPDFKPAKNKLVLNFFNVPDKQLSDAYIESTLSDTKVYYNKLVESWGVQPDQRTMYATWLLKLAYHSSYIKPANGDLELFITRYHKLAEQYPALDFDETTEKGLKALSANFRLKIVSNTLFLDGYVLKKWMKDKGWDKYIESYRFSDEQSCSKPHPAIFYEKAIYHIGDNPITDEYGAKSLGIGFIGINGDYGKTMKDAVEQIYEEQREYLTAYLTEDDYLEE